MYITFEKSVGCVKNFISNKVNMSKETWFRIVLAIIIVLLIVWIISSKIRENYLADDPMLHDLKETIRPLFETDKEYDGLLSTLNYKNVFNKIKLLKGDKSYTINKEKVYLCLKDEKGSYYSKNMLIYVTLHELSHVICPEIGHTDLFYEIFQEVLDKASDKGIYNPSIPLIKNYCTYND